MTIFAASAIDVPILQSNGEIDHSAAAIFVDGGSRPNPGSSAAAIAVRRRTSPTEYSSEFHSAYYPLGTNNIAEAIALLAGLRKAHRMLTEGDTKVNIISDSEILYKMTLGVAKCEDKKLVPILCQIKDAFMPVAGRVVLATMRRQHGNPADTVCTKAILQAKGEGDPSLFIDIPVLPSLPRVQYTAPAASVAHPSSQFAIPANLNEFATLRRFHTRTSVPEPAAHLWSLLTKHYLTLWSQAAPSEKHAACIRFLMLPHLFLPKSVSNNRIVRHLEMADPFHLNLENINSDRRTRQSQSHQRLSEAVTRLVSDRKLGAANKLLHNVTETDELSFDEKVDQMKKKILDGNFSSTIPKENIPIVTAHEVTKAIRKANRNAANAIDGWTKELLSQAVSCDIEIANLLGVFLSWILTDAPEHTRSFLLLARGVAIPNSNKIRPICVSSIFIKILGSIVTERDGNVPSEMQFAIGKTDGHKRVVHKVRKHIEDGDAIIKLDCSNAYGTLPRSVIEQQLSKHDKSLQQYFRFVYGKPTQVVLFGTSNARFITLGEGVKQGDATSSHFFCLGLDRALLMMRAAAQALGIRISVYAYMDDITIAAPPEYADQITKLAISALAQVGLRVNEDKSAVLSTLPSLTIPHHNPTFPFIILGANVSPSPAAREQYVHDLSLKQRRYFDNLKQLPLHPQITFTILKICGYPRIQYHCSVTPPDDMCQLTLDFDQTIKSMIEQIIDPCGRTQISQAIVHSIDGAAAPSYYMNRQLLWSSTSHFALTDDPDVPRVSLTTEPITTTASSQVDRKWMMYDCAHTMTPSQFSIALGIHLNVMPHHLALIGTKCNCGFIYSEHADTINHILKCDMSTPKTHTYRHDMVRDTMVSTARWFGITTTSEPHCFAYADGSKKRPDILFHTRPMGIVTDLSLVEPDTDLASIENLKTAKHSAACNTQHCIFIPAIMHTRGTIGMKAEFLIRTLSKAIPPFHQKAFSRNLNHAIQVAAAKGRADSLVAAADRLRW
jgi:hypothetical protein